MSGADGWRADPKTGLWTFDTGSVGRKSGFNLWRDFNDRSGTSTSLQSIAEQDATARISILGGPGFSTFDLSASSNGPLAPDRITDLQMTLMPVFRKKAHGKAPNPQHRFQATGRT